MFKHLLITAAQASQFRHVPENFPAGFVCSCCNEALHLPNPGERCSTGYARGAADELICYPCADNLQRAAMLDRSHPVGAYIASDGRAVTTWTGGILGRVSYWTRCELTRRSRMHGTHYRSIHVIDVHGAHWHGRGSPGLAVSLRPCKGG